MGPLNGVDLARRLHELRPDMLLIFVTNYVEYSLQGYEVQAFRCGRYACGIKYDTHEGGKSMEMNSVMATEIVAAEVEHIVLPQIVSIKQASRMLGLPPYYLRRLCKEVPGVAFQSGIKWYINLGKLVDYYNNSGRNAAG